MGAPNPNGDSTITGLPLAQTLNGSEIIPADQNQSGTLVTVGIPSSRFQLAQGATGLNFGTTAQRPALPYVSQPYLDTTLGIMIWCKQASPAVWIDAAGVQV